MKAVWQLLPRMGSLTSNEASYCHTAHQVRGGKERRKGWRKQLQSFSMSWRNVHLVVLPHSYNEKRLFFYISKKHFNLNHELNLDLYLS